MKTRIFLEQGDITRIDVDAIVNAANPTLLGGGGVDGAIHRAAGPRLKEFCRTLKGAKWGEAKISPGFELPAGHVIHAVGPRYGRHEGQEASLLGGVYLHCLRLAQEYELASIAFPNISTGAYNYPLDEAAEIAIACVKDFLNASPMPQKVIFVCFDRRNYDIYDQRLRAEDLID